MGCGTSVPVAEPEAHSPEPPPRRHAGPAQGGAAAAAQTSSPAAPSFPPPSSPSSSSSATSVVSTAPGAGSGPGPQTSVWALTSALKALSLTAPADLQQRRAAEKTFASWTEGGPPSPPTFRKDFLAKEGPDRVFACLISALSAPETDPAVAVRLLSLLDGHAATDFQASLCDRAPLACLVALLGPPQTQPQPQSPGAAAGGGGIGAVGLPFDGLLLVCDLLVLTLTHTTGGDDAGVGRRRASAAAREHLVAAGLWPILVGALRGLQAPSVKVAAAAVAAALVDGDAEQVETGMVGRGGFAACSMLLASCVGAGATSQAAAISVAASLGTPTPSPDKQLQVQAIGGDGASAPYSSSSSSSSSSASASVAEAVARAQAEASALIALSPAPAVLHLLHACARAGPAAVDALAATPGLLDQLADLVSACVMPAGLVREASGDAVVAAVRLLHLAAARPALRIPLIAAGAPRVCLELLQAGAEGPDGSAAAAAAGPGPGPAGGPGPVSAAQRDRLAAAVAAAASILELLLAAAVPPPPSQDAGPPGSAPRDDGSGGHDDDDDGDDEPRRLSATARPGAPSPPPVPADAGDLLRSLTLAPVGLAATAAAGSAEVEENGDGEGEGDGSSSAVLAVRAVEGRRPLDRFLEQIQGRAGVRRPPAAALGFVTVIARVLAMPGGPRSIVAGGTGVELHLAQKFLLQGGGVGGEGRLPSSSPASLAVRRRIGPLLWTLAVERALYTAQAWQGARLTWKGFLRRRTQRALEAVEAETRQAAAAAAAAAAFAEEEDAQDQGNDGVDGGAGAAPSTAAAAGQPPQPSSGSPEASPSVPTLRPAITAWKRHVTVEGLGYYHDEESGASRWAAPAVVDADLLEPPQEDDALGLPIFWALYRAGYFAPRAASSSSSATSFEGGASGADVDGAGSGGGDVGLTWADEDPVLRVSLCAVACEALCDSPYVHPDGRPRLVGEEEDDEEEHHAHWPHLSPSAHPAVVADIRLFLRGCVESLEAWRKGLPFKRALKRAAPSLRGGGGGGGGAGGGTTSSADSSPVPSRKGSTAAAGDLDSAFLPGSPDGTAVASAAASGQRGPFGRTVSFSSDGPMRRMGSVDAPRSSAGSGTSTPTGGRSGRLSGGPGTPNPEPADAAVVGDALLPRTLPFLFTEDHLASLSRLARSTHAEVAAFAAFVIRDVCASAGPGPRSSTSAAAAGSFSAAPPAASSGPESGTATPTKGGATSRSRRGSLTPSRGGGGGGGGGGWSELQSSTFLAAAPVAPPTSDETTFFGGSHLYAIMSSPPNAGRFQSPIMAAVAGLPGLAQASGGGDLLLSSAAAPRPLAYAAPIPPPPGLGLEEAPSSSSAAGVTVFRSPLHAGRIARDGIAASSAPPQRRPGHRCLANAVTLEDLGLPHGQAVAGSGSSAGGAAGRPPTHANRSRSQSGAVATGDGPSGPVSASVSALGAALVHLRSMLSYAGAPSAGGGAPSAAAASGASSSSSAGASAAIGAAAAVVGAGTDWQFGWTVSVPTLIARDHLVVCGAKLGLRAAHFRLKLANPGAYGVVGGGTSGSGEGTIQQAKARLRKTNAYANRYGRAISSPGSGGTTDAAMSPQRSRTSSVSEWGTAGEGDGDEGSNGLPSAALSSPSSPSLRDGAWGGRSLSFSVSSPDAKRGKGDPSTNQSPSVLLSGDWELGHSLINEALVILTLHTDGDAGSLGLSDGGISASAGTGEGASGGGAAADGGGGASSSGVPASPHHHDAAPALSRIVDTLAATSAAADSFRKMREKSASKQLERLRSKYLAAAATGSGSGSGSGLAGKDDSPRSPLSPRPSAAARLASLRSALKSVSSDGAAGGDGSSTPAAAAASAAPGAADPEEEGGALNPLQVVAALSSSGGK